ncbi:MAG: PKD domain-containing protein, partial [Gammaproteobacteria bacterium]
LPQRGCVPYATTFNASINTLDNVTSYLWDFGDGNTSTQATPSHTYPNQGNYTVSLTVTTSTGCTETYTLSNAIVVGRVPVIDFTASPNPVCAYGIIQFTGIANEGDTWQWDFGDGSGISTQSPTHQYVSPGSYNVTLTVTNNGCPLALPKPGFVSVNPPVANFNFSNDCVDRKRFNFSDQSTGGTSWLWDFGDGNTSTQKNPTHTFAAFGTYAVTLTTFEGSCSHSHSIQLKVFNETPSFTASTRVVCKSSTIAFTAQSNNLSNIVVYNWDLGNGTSNQQNPQATYTASGDYNVRLVTTDIYGCNDTAYQANYIRINGPTAAFTVPVNEGCRGFTASFSNQSTDDGLHPITSWQWNYGDGNSQTS